jgi:hypothetical protein
MREKKEKESYGVHSGADKAIGAIANGFQICVTFIDIESVISSLRKSQGGHRGGRAHWN